MSTKIIAQLNPFSSERKKWNEDDSSISEIIKKIDCQNAVNAGWRILLNDEIITDFSTVTHDGDTLYIKIVPEGDSPKELGAGEKIAGGLLTALGVAALFIPGLGPAVGIALIGSGIGLFSNGCVMYNLDLSQKDRESPVQDPSIRGSKNQIRQYGNIPILFGKRRIYPDPATTAYTWVENGQQYLYQLFCCGQKNQTIDTSTIKIGETLLTDYSSSGNIEDVLSGDDSLIQMQIAYGENTPPLLTKCVHEDILNTVLKHQTEDELDGSIIRTTPENTTEINVDIFFYNGLGQYNDDGDVEDCSVTVKAWYKRSDQDDSHYVQLGHFTSDDVITEHELKTKRFSIHKTGLTANSYTVKIERVTEDSDNSKIIDQCYVGSIRAIKNESPVSSARCRQLTLIGLKIKSSEKLNNYIEQLNFLSQSSLPCYSGTGSGALQWNNAISSNPASAAIYAMQGEVSQQKLNNSEIDWPAFEKLYTWCNQHEYECNEYLTDSMSISELLSAIGSTCRAEIFRQNGKITVIQDIERDGFVQLFTPRNSWDYEESIAMPDIPDAMALGFVDEEAGYVKQEAKIYNTSNGEKISEPETTQDVTLWGVTSSKQARKLGMYKYAVSRARPIVHKFSADFEYMLCGKGDWIKYAGDIALAGITQGRIASLIINGNTITGFTSDELLLMEDGQSYAVRIRKNDGTAILKNISSHSEDCMTVYFDTAVSLNVLHEGDLFSFGYVGNDSIDLIITDIHCGDNLSAEIIAVEYSPEIFAVDNPGFVLPTFINRITEIPSIEDSGQLSDIEEPVKIVTTSILYAASSNGVTPPATGWDSSIPTVTPGNFLWTQTKVFYTNNKSTISYSVAKQGDDGANAIVMTSATTPSGTYVNQIGLWQSQLYKWNGTEWENTSAVLPTDSVLHYSFDEVPDLPDGNADLRTTDGETYNNHPFVNNASTTFSNVNGNVRAVIGSGSSNGFYISKFLHANKFVKLIFTVSNLTGSLDVLNGLNVRLLTITKDGIYEVSAFLNSTHTYPHLYFLNATCTIDFTDIYIGDGSYNTPVIDNSSGKYNAINNCCFSTKGVNGKAIKNIYSNGYIDCNKKIFSGGITVSIWVNNNNQSAKGMHILDGRTNTYSSAEYQIFYVDTDGKIEWNNGIETTTTPNNVFLFDSSWHLYTFISDELTFEKIYRDGQLVAESDDGQHLLMSDKLRVLNRYSITSTFAEGRSVDDLMVFDRILTEEEILGLYLAKGNTEKYYTLSDYQIDCIDNDGKVTPSEKLSLLSRYRELVSTLDGNAITSSITYDGEVKRMIARANGAFLSTWSSSGTSCYNYISAIESLRSYLWTTVNLQDMSETTNVSIGSIDAKFNDYRKAYEELSKEIERPLNLPTDAIAHYSFDEFPDIFDTTPIFKSENAHYSVYGLSGTNNIVAGHTYLFKFKGNSTKGSIRAFFFNQSWSKAAQWNLNNNEDSGWIVYKIGSDWTGTLWFQIYDKEQTSSYDWTLEYCYLYDITNQTLSYNIPVIDNAKGKFSIKGTNIISGRGINGKGLEFYSGINSYVNIKNIFDKLSNNFSISIWVNPQSNTYGETGGIFGQSGKLILRNGISWSNSLMCYIYTTDGEHLYYPTSSLPAGEWSNVVLTKNGTSFKIYVNSVLKTSATLPNAELNTSSYEATLGRDFNISTRTQFIDDFLVFNRALSEEEVRAIYINRGNTPKFYTKSDYDIEQIDNDGVVSVSEKQTLLTRWKEIYNATNVTSDLTIYSATQYGEFSSHLASASSVGVTGTPYWSNYQTAVNNIRKVLWVQSDGGILIDMNSPSSVSVSSLDNLFSQYNTRKEELEFVCRNANVQIGGETNYYTLNNGKYLGAYTTDPSASNYNVDDYFYSKTSHVIKYKATASATSWTTDNPTTNNNYYRYINAINDIETTCAYYQNVVQIFTSKGLASEGYVQNNVSTYQPKYLGKYASASSITSAHIGDWYFNTTNVALYKYNGSTWSAVSYNEGNKYMFNACASDVLSYANSSGSSEIKAFAVAYIGEMFVNHIKVGTNGSIYGGDRYNESGELINPSKNGFYFKSNGEMRGVLLCALTDNVLIGDGAGASMLINSASVESQWVDRRNVCIGLNAGNSENVRTTGNYENVLIGDRAGYDCTGVHSVGIGSEALSYSEGYWNIGIGYEALWGSKEDSMFSVGIGRSAGQSNNGKNLVAIGVNAALSNTGNNVIAIGYKVLDHSDYTRRNNEYNDVINLQDQFVCIRFKSGTYYSDIYRFLENYIQANTYVSCIGHYVNEIIKIQRVNNSFVFTNDTRTVQLTITASSTLTTSNLDVAFLPNRYFNDYINGVYS